VCWAGHRSGELAETVSKGLDHQAQDDVHGVYLLFKEGMRPRSDDIYRFVSQNTGISVSYDPADKPRLKLVTTDGNLHRPGNGDWFGDNWLELLSSGLTFDLIGLAPGSSVELPAIEHRFDFDQLLTDRIQNAVNIRPGSHILEAAGTVPVLKVLLRIARDLIQHFEQVEAVVWPYSESIIGRRFFESTVTAYLEGGAFPALGLIAFHETIDGGLRSHGLFHVIGQELRIEPDLASDKLMATRLAVRLINQLVLSGTVRSVEEVVAPDGRVIRLEPSPNARFVRVWSG